MYIKGLCLALALFLASEAGADTVAIKYLGVSPGFNVYMSYDDDGSGSGSAGTQTLPVGAKNWAPLTGSNNQAPFNSVFKSFCIDIDQSPLSSGVFTIRTLEEAPDTDGEGAASPDSPLMSHQQADYL